MLVTEIKPLMDEERLESMEAVRWEHMEGAGSRLGVEATEALSKIIDKPGWSTTKR